jgi:GTPase SAR1 family protein
MKVVVGGPPHSGKSTFTAGLIERIRERKRKRGFNISFNWLSLDITDNSLAYLLDDTGDISRRNEEIEWNEETARVRRSTFESRDEQLVIADAPGQLTDELDIVMEPADIMIVLASDENSEMVEKWEQRAENLDIEVIKTVITVLDSGQELGWEGEDERQGTLRSISREDFDERGAAAYDDVSSRMIRQMSRDLIESAVY